VLDGAVSWDEVVVVGVVVVVPVVGDWFVDEARGGVMEVTGGRIGAEVERITEGDGGGVALEGEAGPLTLMLLPDSRPTVSMPNKPLRNFV
jgi:hypothetical protein